MIYLSYFLALGNILLQATVLVLLLLRGLWRPYLVVFLYCIAQLCAMLLMAGVMLTAGVSSILYGTVYWTADVVLDLLRFLMVISMTYKVMEGNPMRPATGRLLAITGVAAVVLPFVLFHPFFSFRWFLHTGQLLSLGGAVMNLLLWTAIISKHSRDIQLLRVSAGLGIAVTGVAVAYGLLQFTSRGLHWVPDTFKAAMLLFAMMVWCWAFWPAKRPATVAQTLAVSDSV